MSVASTSNVVEIPKGEVCYTLSREHRPVVTVDPGTRLRIETELNFGDVLHSVQVKFELSMLRLPYVNGATGPIAVRGATLKHALVCRIEKIALTPPGFTRLIPGIGTFPDWLRRQVIGVQSLGVGVRVGHL